MKDQNFFTFKNIALTVAGALILNKILKTKVAIYNTAQTPGGTPAVVPGSALASSDPVVVNVYTDGKVVTTSPGSAVVPPAVIADPVPLHYVTPGYGGAFGIVNDLY